MSNDASATKDDNTQEANEQLEDAKRPINKFVTIGVLIMLSAMAGAVYFAFSFVEDERARAKQEWQIRLSIVADSRARDINNWFEANFLTMRELAENASLQLYMSEIASAQDTPPDEADPLAVPVVKLKSRICAIF